MSVVVAGVVLLLASLIGVASYAAIPHFEKKQDVSDSEQVHSNLSPAAPILQFFEKRNWKQWLFVGAMALLCAVLALLSHRKGITGLELCRRFSVVLMLLAAMIIDMRTHTIPNLIVLASLGIGAIILLIEFLLARETFVMMLIMSGAGLFGCVVLFYLLSRLTKEGMGMGDVKLVAAMGWLLGIAQTLTAVLFALILCTLTAVFLIFGKKKNKNDSVPFGPFLFFGYIILLLLFSI